MTDERKRQLMLIMASNPIYDIYESQVRQTAMLGMAVAVFVPFGLFILALALM